MGYVGKVKVNGVTFPIGNTLYGTCTTPADVQEKVVALDGLDNIKTGTSIHVKFMNSNTTENPKMNVNELGAKPIYRYMEIAPGITSRGSWLPGAIISFTYDGVGWIMNDYSSTDDMQEEID